jgi:hypothetical protein
MQKYDNIQYPMSNIECPSGAGVWYQHFCMILDGCLRIYKNDLKKLSNITSHAYKGQSKVLIPNTRTTWTFDIGYCRRTLNIPEKTT